MKNTEKIMHNIIRLTQQHDKCYFSKCHVLSEMQYAKLVWPAGSKLMRMWLSSLCYPRLTQHLLMVYAAKIYLQEFLAYLILFSFCQLKDCQNPS